MPTTCSCVGLGLPYAFCPKCFGTGEVADEPKTEQANIEALTATVYKKTGEDKAESVIMAALELEPQRCIAAIICMHKQCGGSNGIGYAAIGEYGTCPECQHEAKCMLDDIKGQM